MEKRRCLACGEYKTNEAFKNCCSINYRNLNICNNCKSSKEPFLEKVFSFLKIEKTI